MRKLVTGVALMALSCAVVQAHHSISSVYDSAQVVTLEGVVTSYHFVNPHPFVEVDVTGTDGQIQRWRLEMDNLRELADAGMSAHTLNAGDRVVAIGTRARNQSLNVYVRSLQRPADGFMYEQVGPSPRVRLPQP